MSKIILNTIQAAEFLGFSHKTLEEWRTQGKGPPFVKMGRSVRYRMTDLQGWIDGLESHSSTAA